MSVPDEGWRTQAFRQSVIARIDDTIRTYGIITPRKTIDMENHVFLKAKSREEYLGFVARLILHIRDMNNNKSGMQGTGQPQAGGMPDLINALQNLASQGSRNNQMLNMGAQQNPMRGPQQQMNVNVFQTLNRGPGGAMPNMQANIQNRMATNGSQLNNPIGTMNQMSRQIPNQMPTGNMNQLCGPMQNTLNNQMQNNMSIQMGNQQLGQLPGQIQMNPGLQNTMGGPMGNQLSCNPTPTQFLQQSPSSSVQSPAGITGPPTSNQMVASPALAPSPGANMNMMTNSGPPRSIVQVPFYNQSDKMPVPDEGWRTQAFRQSVIARIDDAIRTYGMITTRNSIDMENHVFLKAKSREEYLGFVARLILHVRDMNNKKSGMQGTGQPQAGGMPDPINALQNLASQGNSQYNES